MSYAALQKNFAGLDWSRVATVRPPVPRFSNQKGHAFAGHCQLPRKFHKWDHASKRCVICGFAK